LAIFGNFHRNNFPIIKVSLRETGWGGIWVWGGRRVEEGVGFGEGDGLGDGDGLGEGDGLGDGDGLGEGDRVANRPEFFGTPEFGCCVPCPERLNSGQANVPNFTVQIVMSTRILISGF